MNVHEDVKGDIKVPKEILQNTLVAKGVTRFPETFDNVDVTRQSMYSTVKNCYRCGTVFSKIYINLLQTKFILDLTDMHRFLQIADTVMGKQRDCEQVRMSTKVFNVAT